MIGELAPIENIVRSLQSLNPSLDDIPEPIDCYCCHKPSSSGVLCRYDQNCHGRN